MDKLGDQGTTRDGDSGQTRQSVADAASNAVPALPVEGMKMAPDRLSALSTAQKEKIEANSRRKVSFLEQEYWRLRNGKQCYMRCPYCVKGRHGRRKNFVDGAMCCVLFAKAFGAILERQNAVDVAQRHASNILRLAQAVQEKSN